MPMRIESLANLLTIAGTLTHLRYPAQAVPSVCPKPSFALDACCTTSWEPKSQSFASCCEILIHRQCIKSSPTRASLPRVLDIGDSLRFSKPSISSTHVPQAMKATPFLGHFRHLDRSRSGAYGGPVQTGGGTRTFFPILP